MAAPPNKPTREAVVLAGIARLELARQIDAAQAGADRSAVTRAVRLIDHLPSTRARPIASALAQVAALAGRLSAPRAAALFGQLAANDDWFVRHDPPPAKTDITGAGGIVYRYFPATCFEFHPLANFAALNAAAASGNVERTSELAAALIERGVREGGGGIGWEYYFDYAGGEAPWLSGFAQAVAAQAFAHASTLLSGEAPQLLAEAGAAYRTIPGRLDEQLPEGPWIKLYSFNRDAVLNAQLQTVISLGSYADVSSNTHAASLAAELERSAAKALPLFDTGYWTYYSLGGDPSPLDYQEYVVELLRTLASRDPRFAAAAARFGAYQSQPPLFKLANAGPGGVKFWLSKPGSVSVSALGSARRLAVSGGWHTVLWRPRHAGIFPVQLRATDWAGNTSSAEALPIVRVIRPPKAATRARLRADAVIAPTPPSLPSLVVGTGLDEPAQARIAKHDGFDAVQMTLSWNPGSSEPAAGAVAALDRLPAGTDLVLDLYASALPSDAPGRAELAAYAAALASQVPTLHDLMLGPAPAVGAAAMYEPALAAVYDAVKEAAPSVRVSAVLDGSSSPASTLAALAASYRTSDRTAPLMDELAFQPAPAPGPSLWDSDDIPELVGALGAAFAGTTQPGSTLPLIVDDLAYVSRVPSSKASLYRTLPGGAMAETAQAAAYATALRAVSCQPTVGVVLLDRLVDRPTPGGQDGLYYADSSPKSSLDTVLQAIDSAQSAGRGCTAGSPSGQGPAGVTTVSPPLAASTATAAKSSGATILAAPASIAFPHAISTDSPVRVHLGCLRACLFLVTLQRASDGAPVLAERGALTGKTAAQVALPPAPIPRGSYRFAVWLVAQDDPGSVTVTRSPFVVVG